MRRVGVVLWIAVAACDRGAPPHREAPTNAATPNVHDAAPTIDGDPSVGAARVDAEVLVDAMPLAPPKPPAEQKRDCTKLAHLDDVREGYSKDETRDKEIAIRKLCIETPWSATIIDCALHAGSDQSAYHCIDERLPPDQLAVFNKRLHDIFCDHNDCIPDGLEPHGDDIDKLLNGSN